MTKWREWHVYVLTIVVACVVTYFALQLWDANFAIPFQYTGDALPTAAHFKDTIATGWYDFNPLLGAPYGQTFNDYPEADNLPVILALVVSVFTHNYAIVLNVVYVLGYPLIAVSALWFLRRLGISRFIAMSLAVVYAIAPYHFYRAEPHLYLGSYFVVPLSLAVVMMVIRGEPLWGKGRSTNRLIAWISGPAARTVVIAALTGVAESYYCVFFLALVAFAGVCRLLYSGDWRRFWGAAVAGATTAVALLLDELPTFIFTWVNGPDAGALSRGHVDSEIYALKLTQLLLPWEGSRIGILQHLRLLYDTTYPLPSEDPALGAIAAVGFVALFLVLAYSATVWGRRGVLSHSHAATRVILGQLAGLTFVAFLFSTVGGLSTLVSFVTSTLRGWNRMSIFIALFSLAAVGILLDLFIKWVVSRRELRYGGIKFITIGIATVLLIVAFVDQTPANQDATYAATAVAYKSDDTWIKQIQKALPHDSMVLQLPYEPFPETVSNTGVLSSEQDIPFLHSDSLRWTGAGIKGRPRSDWPGVLAGYSGEQIIKLAAAAGVNGIEFDRKAYGPGWSAVEHQLETGLGDKPTVSANKRYTFFNLTQYRERVDTQYSKQEIDAVRSRVINPLDISTTSDFTSGTDDFGAPVLLGKNPQPTFTVENASDRVIHATMTLEVEISQLSSGADAVAVTLPDGTVTSTPFVNQKALVRVPATFPRGESSVRLTLTGTSASASPTIQLKSSILREAVIDKFLAN